jgi:formylglycine-generating enzyme required for sulfatase activity
MSPGRRHIVPTMKRAGWPLKANINGSTVREAMGYPEHFVRTCLQENESASGVLAEADVGRLARLVEDPMVTLAQRIAAGNLLALIGDPRIDPFAPAMVGVPGGTWRIGLDEKAVAEVARRFAPLGVRAEWIAKEVPRHSVILSPFRIGKYPVTNRDFVAFLEDSGWPEIPTSWAFGRFPNEQANHPVYSVTPAAADAYAAWLTRVTGRRFRLPSEAEWEVAAAGDARAFPWGDAFEPERSNTLELGLLTTTPVGAFPGGASPYGALDMAGNVEEIVSDEYRPYPGGSFVRDDLANAGSYRMTRGGSFTRFRDLARCARRHGWFGTSLYAIGFRLAEGPAP